MSLSAKDIQTGAAAELLLLINEVTDDGKISREETDQLRDWLGDGRLSEFPGIVQLKVTLNKALEDGEVTDAERAEVFDALLAVLPPDLRSSVRTRRRASAVQDEEAIKRERAAQKEAEKSRKQQYRQEALRNMPVDRFDFMVAGCSFEGRGYAIDKFADLGTWVKFCREPNNIHDRNAVKLLILEDKVIGYVPRGDAAIIAGHLDRGLKYHAWIKKLLRVRKTTTPVVEAEIYTPESTRGNLCLVSNFIGATKGGKFGPTGVPERSKKDATPPSAFGDQKGLAILIGLAAFFVMLARC